MPEKTCHIAFSNLYKFPILCVYLNREPEWIGSSFVFEFDEYQGTNETAPVASALNQSTKIVEFYIYMYYYYKKKKTPVAFKLYHFVTNRRD